jgi:hypothetical protein
VLKTLSEQGFQIAQEEKDEKKSDSSGIEKIE